MTVAELVRELREKRRERERPKDPEEPSAHWPGTDRVGHDVMTSYTVILRTRGCRLASGSGCTVCGYPFEGTGGVGAREVRRQLETALADAPDESLYLKLFTSGSLLDEWELPVDAQRAVVEALRSDGRVARLSIETLPGFVTEETLSRIDGPYELEVATGLETSSDAVRQLCLNKALTFEDYAGAVEAARGFGADVKTYVLLKPPFLPEPTALRDAVRSGIDAFDAGSESVSLNLCNVQRGTLVEHLHRRGEYRPPWLWTAHEAVRRIKRYAGDRLVISDPVASGKKRGPRNCGECDDSAARALERFSLEQEPSILDGADCSCKTEWEQRLLLEEHTHHPNPLTSIDG
ncbi:MAG: hypothetical protein MAG715_00417 [Methanonatronarchaeales archaeon]|nr:hypothetical protein [Methanonatronarchaeales archaeon]